jgi:hypothetical protein
VRWTLIGGNRRRNPSLYYHRTTSSKFEYVVDILPWPQFFSFRREKIHISCECKFNCSLLLILFLNDIHCCCLGTFWLCLRTVAFDNLAQGKPREGRSSDWAADACHNCSRSTTSSKSAFGPPALGFFSIILKVPQVVHSRVSFNSELSGALIFTWRAHRPDFEDVERW